MAKRTRTELIEPKDTVMLTAAFRDSSGVLKNTDSVPQITITDPTGLVVVGPTSAGVQQLSVGKYQYDLDIGITGPLGVWVDTWTAYINGIQIEGSFSFIVNITDTPALNTDGYIHLGDDPGFNYTQVEIFNINKLLKTLRARLNSRGKTKVSTPAGDKWETCDIFAIDSLIAFLANSITLFNEIPHFTFFTFADTTFIDQFHDVIVEGAVIWALASHALIERGAEYSVSDNGINFTPPALSELLNSQFTTLLTLHNEKIKFIKNSFKPHPIGLGSFSVNNTRNTAVRKLRLLRARQIL